MVHFWPEMANLRASKHLHLKNLILKTFLGTCVALSVEAVEALLDERSLAAADSLFLLPFPTTMVAAVSRAVSQF